MNLQVWIDIIPKTITLLQEFQATVFVVNSGSMDTKNITLIFPDHTEQRQDPNRDNDDGDGDGNSEGGLACLQPEIVLGVVKAGTIRSTGVTFLPLSSGEHVVEFLASDAEGARYRPSNNLMIHVS